MNSSSMAGATLERLWIGEVGRHSNMIPLPILYRQTSVLTQSKDYVCYFCCCSDGFLGPIMMGICSKMIYVYSFRCHLEYGLVTMQEPSAQNIPLEEVTPNLTLSPYSTRRRILYFVDSDSSLSRTTSSSA
ncbi:hypothetical protein ACFX15_034741 [Malus domestica]